MFRNKKIIVKIINDVLKIIIKDNNPKISDKLKEFVCKYEYLKFRRKLYYELCYILDIIVTSGDIFGYDDDMSLHNYSKEKDSNFQIIKSILNRLHKYIGGMNIKKCENKPILTNKTDKIKIQKYLIKWYDDRIIPSQRSKINKKIFKVFKKE